MLDLHPFELKSKCEESTDAIEVTENTNASEDTDSAPEEAKEIIDEVTSRP